MSRRTMTALAAVLFVTACGGNPLGNEAPCGGNPFFPVTDCPDPDPDPGTGGGGGTDTGTVVPETFRGNLRSAAYNPTAGTLTVQIQPLDATPRSVTFTRNATFDTAGYEAFTFQETNANRFFVALFDTSADGAVTGGVAGSSQFTEMVWGANYNANTAFTAPANGGLATFTGNYAGLLNSGITVDPSLPPGTPFEPGRPPRTTGDVMINADFTDNSLEGGIRNRVIVDNNTSLDDVFLRITAINSDGTFAGNVTFNDLTAIGTYAGAFGGADGTAVAGAIDIRPIEGEARILERGVFVADRCAAGDPSPCPTTP